MSVKEPLKGDTAYVPPPDDNFVWYKADNERLRGLLREASKAVWMNYQNDLLDRIEAALKEVPR